MRRLDHKTPAVVLACGIGGLAAMRSLGSLGVRVYGVDTHPSAPGLFSRYCAGKYILNDEGDETDRFLPDFVRIAEEIGEKSVLMPISDKWVLFIYRNAAELKKYFIFPDTPLSLVSELISKEGLHNLATRHGIPTPKTLFPKSVGEVRDYADRVEYPVMVKAIYGFKMQERYGTGMVLSKSREETIRLYETINDPGESNIMLQEYIPGGDNQVYIFDGYFNGDSRCTASFTGWKIRQYPIHKGTASLGECSSRPELKSTMEKFFKDISYRGAIDSGYRLDPRDGKYKVLDINPRLGQALRLFVSREGLDLSHVMYADLTGQPLEDMVQREGRRWMIEDHDLAASAHYYAEGSLSLREWLHSFSGLQEGTWFSLSDPRPGIRPLFRMVVNVLRGIVRKAFRLGRGGR